MAVGGIIKVVLSYVLIGIPEIAAMGSAISTVVSYVAVSYTHLEYVQRDGKPLHLQLLLPGGLLPGMESTLRYPLVVYVPVSYTHLRRRGGPEPAVS